jgi:microcystin-dependent protein
VSQPFVGEIRIFGGNFAPAGWMFCDGQLLPISENETLFQLIGTTYGGDGQETFALPDLRGRSPLHQGTNAGTTFVLGESGGTESTTLTVQQIPGHTHPFLAANVQGDQINPSGNLPAQSFNVTPYVNESPGGNMLATAITPVGGSQPHENRQPYLGLNFIISLFGVFPPPS